MLDAVIIGAGLSGLTCAYRLEQELGCSSRIAILEESDRIGGRLMLRSGIDMGGAWSWPSNDIRLGNLLKELGMKTIPQFVPGKSVVQLRDGKTSLRKGSAPCGPNGVRVVGGAGTICHKLAERLKCDIKLGTKVSKIEKVEKGVFVHSSAGILQAKRVIVAVPPAQAIKSITFSPSIGADREEAFRNTNTWMANTGKVCLLYKNRFWLKSGLNGSSSSDTGPVSATWDNSDESQACLCGFVFDDNLASLSSRINFETSLIIDHFATIFGDEARDYLKVEYKSWGSLGTYHTGTSTAYGSRLLEESAWDNRLFFSSTETQGENGHMEGAVAGGERVARALKSL
mmetsp:Transcript_6505/g.10256  ORF Transcript_6505/g.10256 Transcript_6505/m.10256 type:complete len:343 (+) Transcript_6505:120-1148(+)